MKMIRRLIIIFNSIYLLTSTTSSSISLSRSTESIEVEADSVKLIRKRDESSKLELKELHIGGVFPMEAGSGGWAGGQACLPAVEMALDDINSDPNILPNYALRLHHHNSKCQPGLAARQLFELLYKPPVKLILLSGCSPVTTVVAEAAPVWNLVVISYGASSPALSNRERFPTLFRTHPSANMQNPTRVHLLEKFRWKRITILQSVEEVFTSTAKDLEEQCRERGIRVERQSFYGDPTDALKAIKRQDSRIIVGLYYATEARKVLCEAYHHGLYGRKYVWFLIGWYEDTWYIPSKDEEGLNCTKEQMEEAAQYHFTTESIMLSRDKKPAISGMTGLQFLERLKKMIRTDPANTGGWPESPLAYDAVWALALTLNCTMNSLPEGSLDNFTYNNSFVAGKIFDCIKDAQFRGVSGKVKFSEFGDRIARTQIEQMQDGKYVMVGFYDTSSHALEWLGNERFAGGRPPPDSVRIKNWPITVSFTLYLTTMFFMLVGVAFGVSLLYFNKKYASRRIIIQSQPKCNNVFVIGCILCLLSLILMGFPAGVSNTGKALLKFPKNAKWFTLLCHTRVSILMLGFQLAYGALFAKVWIVYKMGATQHSQQLAAVNANNNIEEDSSAATNTPWESIRMLLAAMVGRQAMVATALRKISEHAYGSLTGSLSNLSGKRVSVLNQPIPINKFYVVIGTLCLIDFSMMLFWLAIDPMQRKELAFHLQEPPSGSNLEDIMLRPILELCQSEHHEFWTVIMLSYKALMLLFGLFLSYETRMFKLRYVNDSKVVLLSICNVGMLTLLTGPIVVLFLRSKADPFFGFVSVTVLLCTIVSLGLVFSPKLIFIYRNPQPTKEELNTQMEESTINRSEQLRYEQLLKENAELKRQIELRNKRIAECRRILEEQIDTLNEDNNNNDSNNKSSDSLAKTRSTKTVSTPGELSSSNNNNSLVTNAATTSGVDFEPSTSTIYECTTRDQQEPLLGEPDSDHQCSSNALVYDDKNNNEDEETPLFPIIVRAEAVSDGGRDTGNCSDYDDDDVIATTSIASSAEEIFL